MYSDRSNSAIETSAQIQTNLGVLRAFIGADVIFNGVVIPKPDELRSLFGATKTNQDQLFSDASATYSTISLNFNILVNGSGIVDGMRADVKTAMQMVSMAEQWRVMAEALRNQTLGFDQTARLSAIQSAVTSIQLLYDSNWGLFYQMNDTVLQAGALVTEAEATWNANYNLTSSATQASQSVSSGATQAQLSAQQAKINVDGFYVSTSIVLYCIVSIHLYSASCSAHQSISHQAVLT